MAPDSVASSCPAATTALSDSGYESGKPRLGKDQLEPFEYQPLDRTTDTFRLIRVLPHRSSDGFLELCLWHDRISSATYRCLSYEWGSRSRTHTIQIDGKSIKVGGNLHDFLEEVHAGNQMFHTTPNGDDNPALWIDSICIDQECPEERGQQVQRMGSIYTAAQEVLVWLGKRTFDAEFFQWLQAAQVCWSDCPKRFEKDWETIRSNPYWSRAWIVQEIVLSKSVSIVFPGLRLDWAKLGRNIAKSGNIDDYDDEKAAQLWSVWNERWIEGLPLRSQAANFEWLWHHKDHNSFWSLIHLHRKAKCSDRRDRIYSILGLVHGGESFPVDYKETSADLFWRAGEHFMAWDAPELVDALRIALFEEQDHANNNDDGGDDRDQTSDVNPWGLIDSLQCKPDLHVRIPVRRARATNSIRCRIKGSVKCKFDDCQDAPSLQCTRNDILLCTNARSDGPTEHGCIHGVAHPKDKPAAEPFEINVIAHHKRRTVTHVLPSTAIQVYDAGTNAWYGISTWSRLQNALSVRDLDRADRVKLCVPARFAIWIWFGVHPNQLRDVYTLGQNELPSEYHILPSGTKVTKNSIELPSTRGSNSPLHLAEEMT